MSPVVRKCRDGSLSRASVPAALPRPSFIEVVPREGAPRGRVPSSLPPLLELDLPGGCCLRFSTAVPVAHVASLASALSSC